MSSRLLDFRECTGRSTTPNLHVGHVDRTFGVLDSVAGLSARTFRPNSLVRLSTQGGKSKTRDWLIRLLYYEYNAFDWFRSIRASQSANANSIQNFCPRSRHFPGAFGN